MLVTIGDMNLVTNRRVGPSNGAFRWVSTPPVRGGGLLARIRRWLLPASGQTTVFHVTHHKAGSQWVHRILHGLAYERLVLPEVGNAQFLGRPIRPGAVYPTVYVTREQFFSRPLPRNSRWFVVIRDLRDTLVSGYFSIRYSHAMEAQSDLRMRDQLNACSLEEGLLCLLDEWLPERADVQRSWINGPDDILRYEDMLTQDIEVFERVLLGHCRLAVTPERLREVVLANRFEARSGRRRGQEDVHSHERKGVAGDWRNYFTPAIKEEFKKRYGSLLIATGYEKDFNW